MLRPYIDHGRAHASAWERHGGLLILFFSTC